MRPDPKVPVGPVTATVRTVAIWAGVGTKVVAVAPVIAVPSARHW